MRAIQGGLGACAACLVGVRAGAAPAGDRDAVRAWPGPALTLRSGMPRSAVVLPLVLVTSLALASAQQQPTFRTGTELVTVGATVTDRRGNFITDLDLDDFEVVEDG